MAATITDSDAAVGRNAIHVIEGAYLAYEKEYLRARSSHQRIDLSHALAGLVMLVTENVPVIMHVAARLGVPAAAFPAWSAVVQQASIGSGAALDVIQRWPDAAGLLKNLLYAIAAAQDSDVAPRSSEPQLALAAPSAAAGVVNDAPHDRAAAAGNPPATPMVPVVTTSRTANKAGKEAVAGTHGKPQWQIAQQKAEAYLEKKPWPGLLALARLLGVSLASLRRAKDKSAKIRTAQAESSKPTPSVSAGELRPIRQKLTPGPSSDPGERVANGDQSDDEVWESIRIAAKPSERNRLDAMDRATRDKLILTCREQTADPGFKDRLARR